MRLAIRHTTRYLFDQPVVHALQRLRLVPKATQGQEILDWQMEYTNAVQELEYDDQHHNKVVLVSVDEGAEEVVVTCHGRVDTEDNAGVIGRHSGHLPLWAFLSQTALTKPSPAIHDMTQAVATACHSGIDRLHALSSQIKERVAYETQTTTVETTAEQAFAEGSGVCQDHAHIFIGAARALDIPARYVSGYLMMNDRVEQEATHAWAEAFVQGLGWVGFDISNGISPDMRYVRVATGRDYRDAAPVTGISYGTATAQLEVDVAIEQQQVEQ